MSNETQSLLHKKNWFQCETVSLTTSTGVFNNYKPGGNS